MMNTTNAAPVALPAFAKETQTMLTADAKIARRARLHDLLVHLDGDCYDGCEEAADWRMKDAYEAMGEDEFLRHGPALAQDLRRADGRAARAEAADWMVGEG